MGFRILRFAKKQKAPSQRVSGLRFRGLRIESSGFLCFGCQVLEYSEGLGLGSLVGFGLMCFKVIEWGFRVSGFGV